MNQAVSDFSTERDKVVGQLKDAQVTATSRNMSYMKCFNNFVSVFCSTSFQNFRRERLKVCKKQRSHWKRKIKNFWRGFVLWRTNRLLFSRDFHLNIDIFNKEGAFFCYCGPRNTDYFRTVPSKRKNIYRYICAAYDYVY